MNKLPSELLSEGVVTHLQLSDFFSFSKTCKRNRNIAHNRLFQLLDPQSKKAQQHLLQYWYKNPSVLYERDSETRHSIYRNLKSLMRKPGYQFIEGYKCLSLLSAFNNEVEEFQSNFICLTFFCKFDYYILLSVLGKIITTMGDDKNSVKFNQYLEGIKNNLSQFARLIAEAVPITPELSTNFTANLLRKFTETNLEQDGFAELMTILYDSHSVLTLDEIFNIVMQLLKSYLDVNDPYFAFFQDDDDCNLRGVFINFLKEIRSRLTSDHINQIFSFLDKFLCDSTQNKDREAPLNAATIIKVLCKRFTPEQISQFSKNLLQSLKIGTPSGEPNMMVEPSILIESSISYEIISDIFFQCDANICRSFLSELNDLFLSTVKKEQLDDINLLAEQYYSELTKNKTVDDIFKQEFFIGMKFLKIETTPMVIFQLIGKKFSLLTIRVLVCMLLSRKDVYHHNPLPLLMVLLESRDDLEKMLSGFWSWPITEVLRISFLTSLAKRIHDSGSKNFPIPFSQERANRVFALPMKHAQILGYLIKYISSNMAEQWLQFSIKNSYNPHIFWLLSTRITIPQVEELILILLEKIKKSNIYIDALFFGILVSRLSKDKIKLLIPEILALQDSFEVGPVIGVMITFLSNNQIEKCIEIDLKKIIKDDRMTIFNRSDLLVKLSARFTDDQVNCYYNYLLLCDKKEKNMAGHYRLISSLVNRFSSEQLVFLYNFTQASQEACRSCIETNTHRIDHQKLTPIYEVKMKDADEQLKYIDELFQAVLGFIPSSSQDRNNPLFAPATKFVSP